MSAPLFLSIGYYGVFGCSAGACLLAICYLSIVVREDTDETRDHDTHHQITSQLRQVLKANSLIVCSNMISLNNYTENYYDVQVTDNAQIESSQLTVQTRTNTNLGQLLKLIINLIIPIKLENVEGGLGFRNIESFLQ